MTYIIYNEPFTTENTENTEGHSVFYFYLLCDTLCHLW